MVDAVSQKLVCEPLKRGGRHCLFHACLFCVKPAVLGDAIIVFLDLETTGLSVLTDHIVEIGCVDAKGVVLTTVVNPLVIVEWACCARHIGCRVARGSDVQRRFPTIRVFSGEPRVKI